jgi:hypothetical protein
MLGTDDNDHYLECQRAAAYIEQLEAVVDAARHLLAGGDKEAVYHLEKALEALENKIATNSPAMPENILEKTRRALADRRGQ